VATCGFGSSDAQRVAAAELRRRSPPTGVLALSDSLAYGVYGASRDLGLAVPRDVSVIGFDDLPPSRLLDPPLTAVGWDTARAAEAAAAMVVAAIDGERPLGDVVMTPHLSRRASAGPPAG
jgi:DNA-binding LacI/PurR family transcriptional regulator